MKKFGSYIAIAVVALVVGLIIGSASTSAAYRTKLEAREGNSAALELRVSAAETLVRAEDQRVQLATRLIRELSVMYAPAKLLTPIAAVVSVKSLPDSRVRLAIDKRDQPPEFFQFFNSF